MDSVTQAALGAAIGEAVLGKKMGNKGALIGAAVATIPDLDVAFYLFYDSYDMLSIHRGFSHSILFSIIGAFLIAFLLQKWKPAKNIRFSTLLLFAWLALFTHMLLDAFTSYGTQLFLPFSDARVGLDSINVVDPVYTLPLIFGLVFSLFIYKNKPRRPIFNHVGIAVSTLYLLTTLAIKSHVENHFRKELAEQNIAYQSLLTMPVGIANINWYGVAKSDSMLYMHKYSVFGNDLQPFEVFPINEHYLEEVDPEMAETMRWFAKGFYTVEKHGENTWIYNLQVDMRGVYDDGKIKAPTLGYFELIPQPDGSYVMASGSHELTQ